MTEHNDRQPPARRPLDREQVIAAAAQLADTEGSRQTDPDAGRRHARRAPAGPVSPRRRLRRSVAQPQPPGPGDPGAAADRRRRRPVPATMRSLRSGMPGARWFATTPASMPPPNRYPCAGDPELEAAVERVLAVLGQALRGYDLSEADRVHAARTPAQRVPRFQPSGVGGRPSAAPRPRGHLRASRGTAVRRGPPALPPIGCGRRRRPVTRLGFLLDSESCLGCHACTVACKSEHDVPLGVNRTWVKYIETGSFPDATRHFSVMRCNHCDDAPCISICPTNALFRARNGVVDFDDENCIGCKGCMNACPYDAHLHQPGDEHRQQVQFLQPSHRSRSRAELRGGVPDARHQRWSTSTTPTTRPPGSSPAATRRSGRPSRAPCRRCTIWGPIRRRWTRCARPSPTTG